MYRNIMSKTKQNPPVVEMSASPSPSTSRTSLKDDNPQRHWIRHLLRKYLAKYIREYWSSRKDTSGSPVTSEISILDENGNPEEEREKGGSCSSTSLEKVTTNDNPDETEDVVENNLKNMITLTELEMTEETAMGDDRITYLSRILSIAVSYSVTDHPDHFMQWVVKVPSKYADERKLARMTNAYRREVKFYSEILQDIRLWLELNPITCPDEGENEIIVLNVPLCYYANAQKTNQDLQSKAYEFPNAEFTLILDDLRAHGFGKRHYSIGLTVAEVIEALREIAKLHAVSWAMTEHSHERALTWPDMLKWEDLYQVHLGLIQEGFRYLRVLRGHFQQNEHRLALLDDLLRMEPKLPIILKSLLEPLPAPAVTALVHMDFWTDNLLFKENHYEEEGMPGGQEGMEGSITQTNVSEGSSEPSDIDIDCMILDWQMVSLGRISHDLGTLMMTSLDGAVRREYGMECIKFYYEAFEKIASLYKLEIPFEIQELVAQYKESCLLAILLAVGRFDLVISEQSTMDRFFNALEDLKDEGLI